jgi:hypothetical protein
MCMTNTSEQTIPEVALSGADPQEPEETPSVQLSLQRMFDDALSEIEALHQGWLVKSAAIADGQWSKRAETLPAPIPL